MRKKLKVFEKFEEKFLNFWSVFLKIWPKTRKSEKKSNFQKSDFWCQKRASRAKFTTGYNFWAKNLSKNTFFWKFENNLGFFFEKCSHFFNCISRALPFKNKLITIFWKGQVVVLWPILGSEIQKSQKLSTFFEKIYSENSKLLTQKFKFLKIFLISKIEKFKFFSMLRDNLASRFKIQNASTNVTYGPKNDKNLTILFKFINSINNFAKFC